MKQNITSKKYSYKTGLLIVCTISLICNFVLLSFDSLAEKLSLDLRFDDFLNNPEELISFIFSIFIIVLIAILKDKRKILFSVASCNLINEFVKFIFAVKNYDL